MSLPAGSPIIKFGDFCHNRDSSIMSEHRTRHGAVLLMLILSELSFICPTLLAQTNCTAGEIFQSSKCSGDEVSAEENALFALVNKYRAANGRGEVRPSPALSMVANRRMLDLRLNLRVLTHSWSNCKYDINDQKTWPCVTDSPQRLKAGYSGQGYETLYRTAVGRAMPVSALDAWKKSTLHNSIILNLGQFKDLEWEELGVAIDGPFAALWFGNSSGVTKKPGVDTTGLGVSYDQAVKGLAKLLTIDQTSSTIESNRWQGFSPDRKIKLEIYGTKKEISESNIGITIKLEPQNVLAAKNKAAVLTLLQNIFPEWRDREAWFDSSIAVIVADRSALRAKILRKIEVELKAGGQGSVSLSIRHKEKPTYVELF